MMKRFLMIMVMGLLWCNVVIAEEIKTVWGFSLKVPDNYYYTGTVVGEDIKIPEKFLEGVTNPNLLWFFPKSLDR